MHQLGLFMHFMILVQTGRKKSLKNIIWWLLKALFNNVSTITKSELHVFDKV